ncbi:MAG: ABC transporter ATP-binding protein/permease [Pelosinus sp.]|nr:ABC transporter ATP-binding protein/permease [Pelosinus sp.]
MQKLNRSFFKGLWKISRGFWQSEEKWYAGVLLTIIVLLQFSDVYVLVRYNAWQNTFYNTIQNMDKTGFLKELGYWPLFTFAFLVIEIYKLYLLQLLEVKWRSWLTQYYLKEWLQKQTYYLLQIMDYGTDNPDQRISEDLRVFVASVLDLSLGLLRAVTTLFSFTAILWGLSGEMYIPLRDLEIHIPGYMVWVAIIYAAAGSFLTAKVGNPLVWLNYAKQRYEADFRFSLVRMRENSEGVAFYKGEQREQLHFAKQFSEIVVNFRTLMKQQKKLSWLTLAHWRLSFLFPYIIAVPRLFSGEMQLGGLFQIASAFTQVELALSFFIKRYYSVNDASLSELQAVVERLTSFTDSMERIQEIDTKSIRLLYTHDPSFVVNHLDVALPSGTVLLNNLNLRLKAGDTLLITGASGCGKSTLMKTLAGIWPLGQGTIQIPQKQSLLFLPQKPYLPLGTLRDVILYPFERGANTAKRLREVMFMCQLGHLIEALDKTANWSQILSLGEQQRIAFARAILQQPKWLFLDEATSALDELTEQIMYNLLKDQLPEAAIISVGHRSSLTQYHKLQLSIGKAGAWQLAA